MKYYIIKLSAKTYWRYGGNTRNRNFAARIPENEIKTIDNTMKFCGIKKYTIEEYTF